MSLIHLARQGFITKSALPSVTRTRGASYQPSLLLLGNGTNGSTSITDSSQNAFPVTVVGNTNISTAQKPTGMTSSIFFDGTGDFLTLADNTAFDFGAGDFTIETWVYLNSLTGDPLLIGQWGSSVINSSFLLNFTSTAITGAIVGTNSSYYVNSVTTSLNTGQWYHIAFIRFSNVLRLYLNGSQIGSDVSVTGITVNSTPTNTINIGYKSDTNSYLNGYMSNIRVTKGTALYTKNFFVPTLPLSTFAQQKAYPDLLLLGSGTNGSTTITDSSPNAFTITRNGDTNISTAQYPVGMTSSIYFDGTGDYLSIASNAAFTFGSGDFTVECYIYFVSYTQYAAIVGVWTGTASTSSWLLTQGETSSSKLRFGMSNGSSATFNETSGGISLNNWLHLAVTRQSNTLIMFVNGVQLFSGTMSQNNSPSSVLTVGSISDGSFTSNCYISNLRITKGTALYTGKFNVPLLPLPSASTSPGASPSLYITGDGINNSTNIIDSSPNAFTVTVNGDTKISTAQAPTAMASSVYFDGTGDYLSVANNAAFDFGTGDFTIEAYVYIAGNSSLDGSNRRYANIFSLTTASTWPFGFAIQGNSTTTGTGLEIVNGTAAVLVSTTIQQSTWNHIAVVRSGSSAYFFVNGVQTGATQSISGSWGSSTVAGQVGQTIYTSYNYPLNGYISNLRITKGAALYTTTFVPPPLPILLNSNQIAYPSLLLRGAGANNSTTFTDSSPNAFTVTAFGDAKISTAQYPTGMSSSMYFDGSGDYLTVSVGAIGSGNFTIEGWFYFNSFSTEPHLIDFRPSSTSGAYPTIYVTTGGIPVYTANSLDRISGSSLTTSTWHHIAIVRVGTSTVMYVNGSSVGSAYTDSTNYLSSSNRPTIGTSGFNTISGNFNGYISNVRVVTSALYRSNFTPPPLPASATPQTDLTPTTTASTVTNNVYGVYQLA